MRCVSRLFSGVVAVVIFAVLSGCAGAPPISTDGLYGPDPGRQSIAGSRGQGMVARSVAHSPGDVLAAARQALVKLEYSATNSSRPLVATGRYRCNGSHRVTMAIYAQPDGMGSRVTVLFDNHDLPCSLGNVQEVGATQVFKAIEKALET